jgi:hypothetical protein
MVVPKRFGPAVYFTIAGFVPSVIFAHSGLPGHQVKSGAARPACVVQALARSFAFFWGPLNAKLVCAWKSGVALGTESQFTDAGRGCWRTFAGRMNVPFLATALWLI